MAATAHAQPHAVSACEPVNAGFAGGRLVLVGSLSARSSGGNGVSRTGQFSDCSQLGLSDFSGSADYDVSRCVFEQSIRLFIGVERLDFGVNRINMRWAKFQIDV